MVEQELIFKIKDFHSLYLSGVYWIYVPHQPNKGPQPPVQHPLVLATILLVVLSF